MEKMQEISRMKRLKNAILRKRCGKNGATVVEYVVMAAVAVIVGIGVIRAFWGEYDAGGGGIGEVLYNIVNSIETDAQHGR